MNKFYITTAIDYTDDVIHIGHIYQKIIADVLARYHRLLGKKVFFLTGTDEHGGKVEKAAADAGFAGREKDFVDQIAQKDQEQQQSLNISFDRFIRTTDHDHIKIATSFWQKAQKNGDIYLGNYEGIYCDGCEAFLSKSDLIDGKCPYHPTKEPRLVKEKNYFFRWSKYADFLKNHILTHPDFIWPETRRNEMLAFIEQGIQDIPISRPKIKWGIPVPSDSDHTIYVWFDALINYLSGAPRGFWPADIHVLGKDNTRWHALLWPAMLKSAGYELPKTILVNGFITLNGQKISKSIGNIIRPSELAEKFGSDASRYYFLKSKPIDADGNISLEKIQELYNADLANGLGNLTARVLGMINRYCDGKIPKIDQDPDKHPLRVDKHIYNWKKAWVDLDKNTSSYQFNEALNSIWKFIKEADKYVDDNKPWELATKDKEKLNWVLYGLADSLHQIAWQIYPFLPETSQKIAQALGVQTLLDKNLNYKASWTNIKVGTKISLGKPLFPRIK